MTAFSLYITAVVPDFYRVFCHYTFLDNDLMRISTYFSKKRRNRVGVSLQANTVNFVITEAKPSLTKIVDHGSFESDTVVAGLQQLRQYIGTESFCYFALPYRFSVLKQLRLAGVFKDHEIEKSLVLNAQMYFSCSAKELAFDFETLKNQPNYIRVLAGKKEDIVNWSNAFKQAELNLQLISADVLALEQFLRITRLLEDDKCYAVFLVCGCELLQAIVVDHLVRTVRVTILSDRVSENMDKEIAIFVRLYEFQNQDQLVSDVLVFGHIAKNLSLSQRINVRHFDDLSPFLLLPLPLSALLPLGILLC